MDYLPVTVRKGLISLLSVVMLFSYVVPVAHAEEVSVSLRILPPPPPPNSQNQTYSDPGLGGSVDADDVVEDEDEEVVDEQAPAILDVQIIELSTTSAWILWFSDEDARGTFRYGKTEEYELGTISVDTFTKQHAVIVQGLERGVRYYIKIIANDAADNEGVSQQFFTLIDPEQLDVEDELDIVPEESDKEDIQEDQKIVDPVVPEFKRDLLIPAPIIPQLPRDVETLKPLLPIEDEVGEPRIIVDTEFEKLPIDFSSGKPKLKPGVTEVRRVPKKDTTADTVEKEDVQEVLDILPAIMDTLVAAAKKNMIERKEPSMLGKQALRLAQIILKNELFDQRVANRMLKDLEKKLMKVPHVYTFPYVAPSYAVPPLVQIYAPARVVFSLAGSTILALYQPHLYYLFTIWQML